MGVQGLWQLLDSVGQPVTLESLEGKILAIDVSIWLHQSMKGMRDKEGNALPNAHLIGLFNRICKLLYYRIRPVFVFDGGVPALKQETINGRRQRKDLAEVRSKKHTDKILSNFMKSRAIRQVIKKDKSNSSRTEPPSSVEPRPSTSNCRDFEMYTQPEIEAKTENLDSGEEEDRSSYEDDAWIDRQYNKKLIQSEFRDPDSMDVESDDFKSMPPEIQHEILTDLKEKNKRRAANCPQELPQDLSDFSTYQMAKLMKQNRLSQRLNDVRNEMNKQNTGEIIDSLKLKGKHIDAQRVQSEDSSHYILVKGITRLDPDSETEKNIDEELKTDCGEVLQSENQKYEQKMSFVPSKSVLDWLATTRKNPSAESSESDIAICDNNSIEKSQGEASQPVKDWLKTVTSGTNISSIKAQHSTRPATNNVTDNVGKQKINSSKNHLINVNKVSGHLVNKKVVDSFISSVDDTHKVNKQPLEKVSDSDATSKKLSQHSLTITPRECSSRITCNQESNLLETSQTLMRAESRLAVKTEEITNKTEETSAPATTVDPSADLSDDEDDFIDVPMVTHDNRAIDNNFSVVEKSSATDDAIILDTDDENFEDDEVEQRHDIGQEFKDKNEVELEQMADDLEHEGFRLQQERGKEERLAKTITEQMHQEAQDLLVLFGVPFIVSPMEAEAQCAYLDATDQVHGIITNDSDTWLFDGKRVYKNLFNQDKHVEFYSYKDIKDKLGLDREKLVLMAMLCGSDYTEGITGVGPVTALEILAEFPGTGLDGLKLLKNWWNETKLPSNKIQSETKLKHKLRQLTFQLGFPREAVYSAYFKPEVDCNEDKFTWGKPDLDLLREYAKQKLGWLKDKIDNVLLPVMKKVNEMQIQRTITSYFTPVYIEKDRSIEKSPSKRLKRALNKLTGSSVEPAEHGAGKRKKETLISSKAKAIETLKKAGKSTTSRNVSSVVKESSASLKGVASSRGTGRVGKRSGRGRGRAVTGHDMSPETSDLSDSELQRICEHVELSFVGDDKISKVSQNLTSGGFIRDEEPIEERAIFHPCAPVILSGSTPITGASLKGKSVRGRGRASLKGKSVRGRGKRSKQVSKLPSGPKIVGRSSKSSVEAGRILAEAQLSEASSSDD